MPGDSPDPDRITRDLLQQSADRMGYHLETLADGIARLSPAGDSEAERRGGRKFQALLVDWLKKMAVKAQAMGDKVDA